MYTYMYTDTPTQYTHITKIYAYKVEENNFKTVEFESQN